MIPVLLFPQFDPVIVQIGPFAIRWYALAYIAGLVLGWRLLRRLVQQPPAVATAGAGGRFPHLGHARRRARRAARLRAVLPAGRTIWRIPLLIFAVWEGGMSFHGGALGVAIAIVLVLLAQRHPAAGLRRPRRGRGADRARPRTHRQLHQRRAVGPAGAGLAALGDDLPERPAPVPRHPSQLYQALLEGLVLFLRDVRAVPPRERSAPGSAV